MIYSCRGMVWGVDWIHLVWVGVDIKSQGVIGYGQNAYLIQIKRFRGVKDEGSEIGRDEGKEERMIYSCSGMVWGVDWIHMIWVGVDIKKARGSLDMEKMHVRYNFSDSEGLRTRAQRLGEKKVEREK